MCGFAGYIDAGAETAQPQLRAVVGRMAGTLRHRGPDDDGVWVDEQSGVALGHRRLSIVDLSPEGHQPMPSPSGRYIVVYNGEIYNFPELRRQLEALGYRFRGHSDTEVLLGAVEQWGVRAAVQRFVGMFAFALWDRQDRVLTLARDRVGEKPLFYGWMGKHFLFASELKALRNHPAWRGEVDRGALSLFLRHSDVPGPYSIYKGIRKLVPGTLLTLRPGTPRVSPEPVPYWSMRDVAGEGVAHPFTGSDAEAVAELETLLRDSVRHQMVADVPLGAFLSGGVDSSAVVALMQAQSSRPVRTFSIGFDEEAYNEARHAKAVAQHLGTDHTELYVRPEDALGVIPLLPALYDEPFADSSQIPTFLVAQLARQHVTVSLSGDGGDELFGGYNRYFLGSRIWNSVRRIPTPLRRGIARPLGRVSARGWDRAAAAANALLPARAQQPQLADRLKKVSEVLTARDAAAVYTRLVSSWMNPEAVVLGGAEPPTPLTDRAQWPPFDEFVPWMMYLDSVTYLTDDVLAKVDRAAMGVSLETRVPLLDHRVIEFAWRLPLGMKIRGGQGKWALRQVLYQYVPKQLIERPKMGFGLPFGEWMRGPLRPWAESLLEERRLREDGFFAPEPIRKLWRQHLAGERDWRFALWSVLMFQAWLESQQDSAESGVGAG